jgi:hypothetical protein
MITRLLLGEPFPWEAEPLPLCEPLPWELEPLPPCESFASEPELSQTFIFCVTVREPDSKIFVTDLQPAFAGATKEVNTAAAAAIVSPIFLMTLSSENVLRSPAGKITQSCRHHCENGQTGSQFVVHHGHVAVHSACPGGVKRVRGHARTKPGTQGLQQPTGPCGPGPRLARARERCGPPPQGRRSLGRGTRAASASMVHLRTRRILHGAIAAAYCAGVTGWRNTLSLLRPARCLGFSRN